MKKFTFSIVFCLISICSYTQTISVSDFKLLDTDLTANTAGTLEKDQNGETAALIKVVTTQTGFTFDGGALGIVKTKQTPGEVWVYIPRGAQKITIKHPQLGVLRDYYFPCSIESGRTYEMIIVTGEVQTIIKQASNSQYLIIKVTPSNAVVELNNEILPTSDGMAQKFVKLGTYDYRVQAPDYHISAGKVEVNDPNNKRILEIKLNPAFGWIEIPSYEDYIGAQVFIDNALAGTIPMKSKNLSSGEHTIKIVKPLYNPFSQIVIVKDNETTIVAPELTPNYSEVTITVGNDAEIYVNDEKKGKGSWTGKLESGNYLIEAKKEGHRTTMQNIEISSTQSNTHVLLPPPAPIYGEVNITSKPNMADVFIDGKNVGQTPLFMTDILIGKHSIIAKKKGYLDFERDFTIKEKETFQMPIDLILMDTLYVGIKSDNHVSIYKDGNFWGTSKDGVLKIDTGKHFIQVHNSNSGTFGKELEFYENDIYIQIDTKKRRIFIVNK